MAGLPWKSFSCQLHSVRQLPSKEIDCNVSLGSCTNRCKLYPQSVLIMAINSSLHMQTELENGSYRQTKMVIIMNHIKQLVQD